MSDKDADELARRTSPPGPSGPPLVGNTFQFLRDPFAFYDRCREAYDGDVVSYEIVGQRAYMLTHPDDVERVLVTDAGDFGKGRVTEESVGRLAPDGLVASEGQQWQRDRSTLQPMFYRERVESYAATMTDFATATADGWTPGESLAIQEAMQALTMRILAKTLLDVDLEGRMDRIASSTRTVMDRFDTRNLTAFLPLWLPLPGNVRTKRALADVHDLVDEIVDERRRELGASTDSDLAAMDPDDVGGEDLLGLMLAATDADGVRMDEATIRDQLITFLVAGHETTSLTLTYALFLLANNPDEQARLRAELDAELSGPPTPGDLAALPTLRAVVSEALRLYPPAFAIFREPETDVTIRGYEVPAGSVVTLPQWNVHRDGRWWDDPEDFRPARWLDDDADRPEYAYFPFGGGPRHCIGMRFARLEAALVLATLLRAYRFEPGTAPPLGLKMALTLQPDEPVRLVPQ